MTRYFYYTVLLLIQIRAENGYTDDEQTFVSSNILSSKSSIQCINLWSRQAGPQNIQPKKDRNSEFYYEDRNINKC